MFVSINEYRKSIKDYHNSSNYPLRLDNFFDVARKADDLFDLDYQELGSGFTYVDVDGELNNVVVLDEDEAMVNGEKMNLQEFINLLTDNQPELLNESSDSSFFIMHSRRAIEKANNLGFNFNIEQHRSTVLFYTQPINVGLVESIEYELFYTKHGNSGSWRVMCKVNHNIHEAQNVIITNQNMVDKIFVCMFTLD